MNLWDIPSISKNVCSRSTLCILNNKTNSLSYRLSSKIWEVFRTQQHAMYLIRSVIDITTINFQTAPIYQVNNSPGPSISKIVRSRSTLCILNKDYRFSYQLSLKLWEVFTTQQQTLTVTTVSLENLVDLCIQWKNDTHFDLCIPVHTVQCGELMKVQRNCPLPAVGFLNWSWSFSC